MSTDDSISEDVSSSGALSHCHVSADGDGGKESETSLLSSEGTSASGLAVSEGRHSASQTTGGTVESRPVDITPACNKIRSLCLSTEEAFQQGKNLPFINPSSLETLRALVQEIQSSGETDPEIWKDCEGRWLHLFQLVEKQYQGQILAQQEQYQCQIQLIQDEIKALVQLQNRQANVHPHAEFSPTPVTKTTSDKKEYIVPLTSGNCTVPRNVPSDSNRQAALAHAPFSSPSPPLHRSDPANQGEEQRATTMLSSGYGTLSAWDQCVGPAGEDEDGSQGREKHHWSTETRDGVGFQLDFSDERPLGAVDVNPAMYQQRTSGTSQPLTSWAQRQKHPRRPKKSKAGQASPQIPEFQEQPPSPRDPIRPNALESQISQDQHRTTGPSSNSLPLKRSDSLMSEASGLTYWRLHESELYRPLPDCFENSALLLLQEASMSLSPSQERGLSLREIYHNKHRTDSKHSDWEGSVTSSPSSPQVLTLDPASNTRQSDHTSGFTSPSHFSSPSFTTQPHLNPRDGPPVSPDSMVECSPNPVDTDCNSNTSSLSVAGPSPSKMQSLWGHEAKSLLSTSHDNVSQQRRASAPPASEEEGTHTLTSSLKPFPASGAHLQPTASPHMERASSLEDPVVLSLLRQNLREKHSRHVADLRAYYESEIQILKDQLKLRNLPQDLEKSNQVLAERCQHLEKALVEANSHIQELEATNGSLEEKLAEWPDRYAVAGATVKSLQQRLEESKRSGKEKDALAARLKTGVRQLEEAAQKSCREAEETEARRAREYKMLQDLLAEYDSLMKEHEGAKNKLVSAENKLVDAIDQISEMKRVISKLESQVKQLEHESRTRYASRSNAQPSGAGLFHHPDLLLSPRKSSPEPDVTRRKSPHPPSDHYDGSSSRKSQCSQTKQSCFPKKSPYPPSDLSSVPGSSVDFSSADESRRGGSPPECEQSPHQTRQQEPSQWESGRAQASCALTPMMRALIELEDTRATQGRAPWVGGHRATVGFVERRHKELIQEQDEVQADGEGVTPGGAAVRAEQGGGGARNAALLGAQRSVSPEGHRSSSLPPPAQRNIPPTTPTKRETLLAPLSAKSSPKRCPTENYSTAFGHMMPREEHLHDRLNGQAEQRRHSFHSSSPRKRLQFMSTDKNDDSSGTMNPRNGNSQLGWEEPGAGRGADLRVSCEDSAPLLTDKLSSLAEAEKLFDELTQEKLQIEAALSRMPGAGGRVSLQSRLDEVALENRLERLNRELGSLRMTLKRFHILRSSANI